MSSASGANLVRYFFYKNSGISEKRKASLVALAYQAASSSIEAPKAILIRADIHKTTFSGGRLRQDPKGWHGTFAYKDDRQVETGFHVTTHGYTAGRDDFVLKMAKDTPEKEDKFLKGSNDQPVWPAESQLEEFIYSPIAHSHVAST